MMSTAVLNHRIKANSGANHASKAPASFWFLLAVLGQFIFAITVASFYGLTALKGGFMAWNQPLPQNTVAGNTIGEVVLAGLILCATLMSVAGAFHLISRVTDAR